MTDDTTLGQDDRVLCTDCRNRQRSSSGQMACVQPRRAGLLQPQVRGSAIEIGRDFADMPKRCPAFSLKPPATTQRQERHHATAPV